MPAMTATEILDFLAREFAQSRPERYRIESVEDRRIVFRYRATERDLRPGDTVSGPKLMALSDLGMYLAVLAAIGPVALAVTTDLSIHFLRRAKMGELLVETILLKVGKHLAVGQVTIRAERDADAVCLATVTYSIPPTR